MHSRVGRQRQASQNSGTVIAASGGRVVARDVLNSVPGCFRSIFSRAMFPRKSSPTLSPTSPRPRRHHWTHCPGPRRLRPRFPHRGEAVGVIAPSAHSSTLEPRCSGLRPGSAASHRIFLPRMLPTLPSRRVPFSLPAAPGVAGLLTAAVQLPPGVVVRITFGESSPMDALRENLPQSRLRRRW